MLKGKLHLRGAKEVPVSEKKKSRGFVVRQFTLLICLVFVWAIIGPNLFGFEKVEAVISVRGTANSATGATTATTITINKPTGTIEGDVMVAFISAGEASAINRPTGTTEWHFAPGVAAALDSSSGGVTSGSTGVGHVRAAALYRVVTTADSAVTSYSFTISGSAKHMSGGITTYGGVHLPNPGGGNMANSAMFACSDGTKTNNNGGTASSSLSVGGCNLSHARSRVVMGFGFASEATITHTAETGMTQHFSRTSGDLLSSPDVTTSMASVEHASTGASGSKTASTGAVSARYVGLLFALREAVHNFELSAYKWFQNVNSIDFVGISDDISGALKLNCGAVMDKALSVAHDSASSALYIVGYSGCNGENWHIEKRGAADGIPIDTFGSNGYVTYNNTNLTASDRVLTVAIDNTTDANGGSIYVGGYETVNSGLANNRAWRIERLSKANGARVNAFGTNGVISLDLGAGSGKHDDVTALYFSGDGFLYVAGEDSSPSVNGTQWRIEKRNATTGALCDGSVISGVPVCVGGQFGSGGVITSNPSSNGDRPSSITVDESYGYIYIAGQQNLGQDPQWRIEKRNTTTGALCTSTTACSEGSFNGSNGFFNSNPTSNSSVEEPLNALEVEIKSASEKYIYLGGSDKSGGTLQWRMEKLNGITGVRMTGFASSGIYRIDPDSREDDAIVSFAVDSRYNHLYIVGSDGGNTGANSRDFRWRVQKHNSNSSSLCDGSYSGGVPVCGQYQYQDANGNTVTADFPAFGGTGGDPAGVATSNPISQQQATDQGHTRDNDQPTDMIINKQSSGSYDGSLFIIGFDKGNDTTGDGDTQWRLEKRNLLDGTRQFSPVELAPTNVAARPQNVNMQFRLRMLLHLSPASIYVTDTLPAFKLQFAPKVGTCDLLFDGEEGNFLDIQTASGALRWLDNGNPQAVDGAIPRDLGTADPTHGSPVHTMVIQGYEEDNPFNIRANLANNQDGLWDFALRDVDAFGAFCVRAVYNNGTPLNTYSVVPEINLCLNPSTEVLMRHGNYFCGNLENPFFWSIELVF